MTKKTTKKTPNPTPPVMIDTTVDDMNDLALRIWEGQSVSLPLKDRVERIVMRLKAKGYDDMSQLTLPKEGFKKYL